MTDVSWSRFDGHGCIRLAGLDREADVRVRAGTITAEDGLPSMAGRLVADGRDRCFVPRFPFVEGTTYTVIVDGVAGAVLVRPATTHPATTEVLEIFPTARAVPRNLLRLYVAFSAPMSGGETARRMRLVDDAGETMVGALLPMEDELWDAGRRRLTILLDPGRIKRGLVPHREAGYPLRSGSWFQLVVDEGFRDARGGTLRSEATRRYDVGQDERGRVDPGCWAVTAPMRGTSEPLVVGFDRPLDRGLLARCIQVIGPDGGRVAGTSTIGPEERSWRLAPVTSWAPGAHQLVVSPVLEDLAGNSVSRVFDRDLSRAEDDELGAQAAAVTFRPRRF